MAEQSSKKSINPENLDSLSGSYQELSEFTGESPDAYVADNSKDKLAEVNKLLATGTEEGRALIKSLGNYLKTVGEAFRESELTIIEGIEGNTASSTSSTGTGDYAGQLRD